jgi:hypothetical protein
MKLAPSLLFVVLRIVSEPCVVPGHGVCGGTFNGGNLQNPVFVECEESIRKPSSPLQIIVTLFLHGDDFLTSALW